MKIDPRGGQVAGGLFTGRGGERWMTQGTKKKQKLQHITSAALCRVVLLCMCA